MPSELRWLESDTSGRGWGLLCAWISVDLQEETVVSLGNALPTETATAAVDSCPVLQARTNERGERVGKGQLYYAENGKCRNVSGDSSSMNQAEAQHGNSDGSIQPPKGEKKSDFPSRKKTSHS